MKKLFKGAWYPFLIYLLVVGVAFWEQRSLMYVPDPEPFNPASVGAEELEPLDLKTVDGLTIHHWYAPAAYNSKPTIVYFQGNAKGLANRAHKYKPWLNAGYGVLLIGYRGYGNPGKPTEQALYTDARQALFYLMDHVSAAESVILYGESLGTGIATQMALEFPVGGVILEAPYTTYADVGAYHYPYLPVRLLALDRYDTIGKISSVKAPIMVIHGKADKVVPFEEGLEVYEKANEPKTALFVPGADHGNLYDFGVGEAVDNFLLNPPVEGNF